MGELIRFRFSGGVGGGGVVSSRNLKFWGLKVCSKIFNIFSNLKYCSWLHQIYTKCNGLESLPESHSVLVL